MLSKLHFKAIFISLGVFLFLIVCTASGFYFIKRALDQKVEAIFEAQTQVIINDIHDNLSGYIHILYGVRGLFSACDDINRNGFKIYAKSLDLKTSSPDLYSIRFVKVEDDHFIVKYTSEEEEEEVIGFEASSDPIRKETMEIARDTNNVAISRRIENLAGGQPGFIISIPIYSSSKLDTTEDRRKNIIGFVNAVVKTDIFQKNIAYGKDLSFGIFDFQGEENKFSPEKLIFGSSGITISAGHKEYTEKKLFSLNEQIQEKTLTAANRKWILHFHGQSGFGLSPLEKYSHWILLSLGIFLSLLFSFFVYNLYHTRIKIILKAEKLSEELHKTEEEKLELLEKSSQRLANQNEELLKTKAAMTNLLEDMEEEKENLSETNAKNEAVFSSIGDCVVATDEKGIIVKINHATEKKLGWLSSEIIGKHYIEALPLLDENGKLIPAEKRKINIVLKTGQKIITSLSSAAHYYMKKDGSKFPAAVSTTPIMLGEKIIGAIAVFRDITHDKQIDLAKSEFVSLASHQLRTPLSTINWYVEMLLSEDAGEINEEQEKFLKEIYRGSKRMVELVNALLNVSRLELGTFSIEPEPTDMMALAAEVIQELLPQVKSKELTINSLCQKNGTTCPILPPINADPKLMRIVFQNLLTNAVKYTPAKGNINFSLKQDDKTKELHFEVSDSGIGIPREAQNKIFTKLFRADNARETDADGTGLGLYIVKSIVEESGGKIWFESIPGKGTTFYLTLPFSGMRKKEGSKKLN